MPVVYNGALLLPLVCLCGWCCILTTCFALGWFGVLSIGLAFGIGACGLPTGQLVDRKPLLRASLIPDVFWYIMNLITLLYAIVTLCSHSLCHTHTLSLSLIYLDNHW
jgi:hypothetical protein